MLRPSHLMKRFGTLLGWSALLLLLGTAPAVAAPPTINVILWFDTEDYLLPASDDAAKRLAELLTARNIRATFKVVGEKARVLEQRGRRDVIAALRQHDLGYHANFHSVHPTPAEYLADCGLLDGMAEFARREGGGAADVRRIFGVETLSCYGQPGSSWASQAIAGLAQIGVAPGGVPCYVDEGNHVGLRGKPFWYAGALVVYDMAPNWTRMDLHEDAAVEPGKQKVSEIAARLAKEDGGGLISIFYHPCEWVHQEFWDGVNFARGANPPRENWKAPAQRPVAETEAAFQRFGAYLDHIRAIPGVRFVTASDLPALYPDRTRTLPANAADVSALAASLTADASGIDFQLLNRRAYSLADQFELLTLAVADQFENRAATTPLVTSALLGPDGAPPTGAGSLKLTHEALRAATLDTRSYLHAHGRVPARVMIGAEPVPPADFLVALATAYQAHRASGKFPESITLARGVEVLPARRVAQDTPGVFGGWVIHPTGFRAPNILAVARLQAWTLKPAIRVE